MLPRNILLTYTILTELTKEQQRLARISAESTDFSNNYGLHAYYEDAYFGEISFV